ncbi:MAG TPA: alpha/beta hydrolase [Ornithinimicrobium sp.]|nr:alpha/beta hydrolase [Ornithinimicrobium sp.]
MSEPLRPEGIPVHVGDVVLTTPGLSGEAEVHPPASPGMRSAEVATVDLQEALAGADLQEQLTVEIAGPAELDDRGGSRAGGGGNEITVEVPGPGEGNGQVLLYAAEDGSLTWHYPDSVLPEEVATRGGERRTYRIPRAVVAPEAAEGTSRGLLGALGSKLLKVLVFPLLEPALGRAANTFASRWEARNRPALVRWYGPDTALLASTESTPLTREDWRSLRDRPVLLLVHGTFSSARGGFGAMPVETLSALHGRYQGRVLAWEHPSVSLTPRENVGWLAGELREARGLTLDVVTHSRGGLVGRALAERGRELGLDASIRVRTLVMVAPPNAGTALADKQHVRALLDRVTNLVQFVPSAGVGDVLGPVLEVVKQVAVGAFGGLEGIMSMDPGGEELRDFNRSPGTDAAYRVITAEFEPPPGSSLGRIARDAGTDLVFGRVANDLVVPTQGAWDLPDTQGFPVTERLVLDASLGVDHGTFFGREDVGHRLLEWLPG